ncbi:MAG TPA: hypothetical protein VMS86_13785 [Thermoanaerobaculia bacterium]|nr:hypothetical protein [Thermoanaerobaculia bacterium]
MIGVLPVAPPRLDGGDGCERTLQEAGELRLDTGPGRGTDLVIVIPTEE